MQTQRQLSIYIAEFPGNAQEGNNEERFHPALLLVDEGQEGLEVLQQLHFNDYAETLMDELDGNIKMVPNARKGMKETTKSKIAHLYPIIGGYECDTMHAWNHMLEHALIVKKANLLFDYNDRHLPHANNCRAGIVSALRSIGIDVEDEFYKNDAGTLAARISVSSVFSFSATCRQSLEDLRRSNEALVEALPEPWDDVKAPSLKDAVDHLKR